MIRGEEGRRARAEKEVRRILDSGPATTIEVSKYDAGLLLCDGMADELRTKYGVRIDISDKVTERGRIVVIKGEEGRRARAEEAIREVLGGRPARGRKVAGRTSPEHNEVQVKKCFEKKEVKNDLDKDAVDVKSGMEQDEEINVEGDIKEKKVSEGDEMKTTKSSKTKVRVNSKPPNFMKEEVVVRKVEALYMTSDKGKAVRGIERESGARLNLDDQVTTSNFTRVRVRGRREQVEAAKALMARLGRNTLQAPVSGREADAIIREQLATKVQGSTGACLWVVQGRRVVVTGTVEEVVRARGMLEELLGRDT